VDNFSADLLQVNWKEDLPLQSGNTGDSATKRWFCV